ncbi:MAG TPA: PEGA domain-containing protein [Polyangiaceae bacterium]|nr:PEGA domain-containing protein [Polyangiaceae bacterium]
MRRLAGWCVVLALSAGVAAPARADEDPKKVARQHYEAGADAMKKGDYAGARKEFEAAYAVSPNFRVFFDIAEADLGLGLPEDALDAFQRFLADGGEQVPPKQREQVTQQIAQLELGFASLEVVTEPSGAAITVDGAELGRTPLARAVRLRAGVHVVGATRAGAAPLTRVVTLAGGEQQRVALALPDAPLPAVVAPPPAVVTPPPEPTPPPAPPAERHAAAFPVGYVLVGAGILVAGATGIEYAWNRGRLNEYRANQAALETDTSPGRRERVIQNNDLGASINRASTVTVGLGIAAGALLAGGVTWLLVEPGVKSTNERASAPSERWVPDVVVSREGIAAGWRGTW